MKRDFSFVYAYYDNAKMFKDIQQTKYWQTYPKHIRNRLEIIVVDDCSPNHMAADNLIEDRNFELKVFRVEKDIPWNQDCARNIGVHESTGDWLFLSDMDFAWGEDVVGMMMAMVDAGAIDKHKYYTFERLDVFNNAPYKPHPNTYFMHRSLFEKTGGYDEIFAGYYGSDGPYRKRLNYYSNGEVHLTLNQLYYRPCEELPDCCTRSLKRKDGRDLQKGKRLRQEAWRKLVAGEPPLTLNTPYRRVV